MAKLKYEEGREKSNANDAPHLILSLDDERPPIVLLNEKSTTIVLKMNFERELLDENFFIRTSLNRNISKRPSQ